jgi:hypothetical protein
MSSSSRLDQLKRDVHLLVHRREHPAPQLNRGRSATSPHQIPMPGWKDILVRTWGEISENNIFLVAGGVTYAVLLALFPGLAALVSIYGLLLNPSQVETQVAALSHILPPESTQMIGDQLEKLVSASSGSLSISAGVALVLALWSASRGMSGLVSALNISYRPGWRAARRAPVYRPRELDTVVAAGAGVAAVDRCRYGRPGRAVSVCTGSSSAAVAVGLTRRYCGDATVAPGLGRLHCLRFAFQQL